MALSVGSVQHEEVVPRYHEAAVHDLGKAAGPPRRGFTVLRLLPFRLGRFFLDRRDPAGLLPSHAMLRE